MTTWQLSNEAETLTYTLILEDTRLYYAVAYRGTPVIERSPLGIVRADADFTAGLTWIATSDTRVIDETYRMLIGKQSAIAHRGVEQVFTFQNADGALLELAVRAYPDGVAFRYGFPGPAGQTVVVTGETTGFYIPPNGDAWMLPYDKVATWAPAYENEFRQVAIGTAAPEPTGWAFPVICNPNGVWLLLTEAGLDTPFYGIHLEQDAPGGRYRARLPEEPETYGVAPQTATVTLPFHAPWRTFIIGPTAGVAVESSLVYTLSAPSVLADTAWVKPGRVSWSWWSDMNSQMDYHLLVPFVDLAAGLHWEYSLVDYGWHEMRNGAIRDLIAYADARGVGLFLWYNSGGAHNQVLDAGPRDIMNDPARRREEMARLQAWGIKGIKVDFMQSDKQYVMQLYHDILRDAADFKLLVNFHGATVPRGWSRTFPHLLSMEAVAGAEQYWSERFADVAHHLHTIYPYTRNAVGPMDYTPVIFGDAPQKQPHLTTNAHELALSVAFESGLQHFADTPAAYLSQPQGVQDFLKVVPVTWDETRHLAGVPGALLVIARRKGDVWYVAGLNGLTTPQPVAVPLTFLAEGDYTATLIHDGAAPRAFALQSLAVTRAVALTVEMAGRGGFVARICPVGLD
ncbi:MAG TPA: glycoside hydrolase family 97 catalytic domain-containing protein [Anaerolineae bacterium]|nr:glycoside hydrolase family 97 catalytic domain-containing protein [Anaerolineae bacterium]